MNTWISLRIWSITEIFTVHPIIKIPPHSWLALACNYKTNFLCNLIHSVYWGLEWTRAITLYNAKLRWDTGWIWSTIASKYLGICMLNVTQNDLLSCSTGPILPPTFATFRNASLYTHSSNKIWILPIYTCTAHPIRHEYNQNSTTQLSCIYKMNFLCNLIHSVYWGLEWTRDIAVYNAKRWDTGWIRQSLKSFMAMHSLLNLILLLKFAIRTSWRNHCTGVSSGNDNLNTISYT